MRWIASLSLLTTAAIQDPSSGGQPARPSAAPSAGIARVAGEVVRVTAQGERAVSSQWVVLHGIGSSGGRAIDSTRTLPNGSFLLRYDRGADSTAQYFVSTVHHGIAYVSGVLPPDATSDDATLTVFDTTSAPVPLTVRGRHILIFAPTDNPRRRVAEIYDLSNDTTVTRVAPPGGSPLWTAAVASGAEDFSSGPEMLSNEAIKLANGRVTAFAPVAPGLKRIAFTYALPADAFPVSIPVEHPTDVFEVLLEDRQGTAEGPGLEETAPSNIEGRVFRRFQATSMAASSVVTVRVPAAPPPRRETNPALVAVLGIVMAGALIVALRRARRRTVVTTARATPVDATGVESLAREIAELDAAFEVQSSPDDAERALYQAEREQLKRRLAARLAAPGQP